MQLVRNSKPDRPMLQLAGQDPNRAHHCAMHGRYSNVYVHSLPSALQLRVTNKRLHSGRRNRRGDGAVRGQHHLHAPEDVRSCPVFPCLRRPRYHGCLSGVCMW